MLAVAIPSLGRAKTLAAKTLSTLRRDNFPLDLVTVYCVAEEMEEYQRENPGVKIVEGIRGLTKQREFIMRSYPANTCLMFLDDDIEDFVFLGDRQPLLEIFQRGFREAARNGARLWGVYPVPNKYFMTKSISVSLKYIIGSCYGVKLYFPLWEWDRDDKEDLFRTLSYYEEDGLVVRLNDISPKTNYYKEPGGLQLTRTKETNLRATEALVKLFPDYCSLYIRKRTGFAELRLKDKTKPTTIPVPDDGSGSE